MLLWYTAGSIFCVWNVFQSSGVDFRLVAIGALAPLAIDAFVGHQAIAHTLLSAVTALVVVMLATSGRGRRLLRRRWLGFPIGWFSGLVLSAAWANKEVFWWPAFGTDFGEVALLGPWPLVVVEEIVGVAAAVWAWRRFGLAEPVRRRAFVRSGRLSVVSGPTQ